MMKMLGLAIAFTASSQAVYAGEPPARDPLKGIWKSVVPPTAMCGEFGNHDPIGLAAGQRIKADCSLNWTDPDDGKLYCFATATSLAYFLYWPKANSKRAREAWESNY